MVWIRLFVCVFHCGFVLFDWIDLFWLMCGFGVLLVGFFGVLVL